MTALSVGAIVCIAASNGGTTSQDLKTGFLVGATPRLQQIAILFGALRLGARPRADPAQAERRGDDLRPRRARSRRPGCASTRATLPGARESPAAGAGRRRDARELPRLAQDATTRAARPGATSSTTSGRAVWLVDPGINGVHPRARRRHRGPQVRRAQGDAHVLHHQGHPRPAAAVGARALRRHDRARPRDVRHPVARVRGGRLPAALLLDPDPRRRPRPLARRPAPPPARSSRAASTRRRSRPRRTRARASSSPPGTSRAARSPGSSSRSWRACSSRWTASSPAGRPPTTRSSPARARTCSRSSRSRCSRRTCSTSAPARRSGRSAAARGAVEPGDAAAVRRVRPLPVLRAPLPVLRLRGDDGARAARAAVRPRASSPSSRSAPRRSTGSRPRASTSAAARPRSGIRRRSARCSARSGSGSRFPPGAEVTIEVNPESCDRGRLRALRAAGVNRVSVGVQSFDPGVLAKLGRRHGPEAAERAIRAAADEVGNASVDLIYGARRSTVAIARADATRAVAAGAVHVSAYQLTLDPEVLAEEVPLARIRREGRLPLPSDDDAARQGAAIRAALRRAGLRRYEISNFARPGRESVHNRLYWEGESYLGLGAGAYGCLREERGRGPLRQRARRARLPRRGARRAPPDRGGGPGRPGRGAERAAHARAPHRARRGPRHALRARRRARRARRSAGGSRSGAPAGSSSRAAGWTCTARSPSGCSSRQGRRSHGERSRLRRPRPRPRRAPRAGGGPLDVRRPRALRRGRDVRAPRRRRALPQDRRGDARGVRRARAAASGAT